MVGNFSNLKKNIHKKRIADLMAKDHMLSPWDWENGKDVHSYTSI